MNWQDAGTWIFGLKKKGNNGVWEPFAGYSFTAMHQFSCDSSTLLAFIYPVNSGYCIWPFNWADFIWGLRVDLQVKESAVDNNLRVPIINIISFMRCRPFALLLYAQVNLPTLINCLLIAINRKINWKETFHSILIWLEVAGRASVFLGVIL